MKNFSANGEPLGSSIGKSYLLIDALYLNDIRDRIQEINIENLTQEIREKIFPFTDTPFAEYIADTPLFHIERIKKVNYEDFIPGDTSFFSTDTGLLIFVRKEILYQLLDAFDYDQLTGSSKEIINSNYWKLLVSQYDLTDLGLVLSPGIDAGYDLTGSGTYKIS